MALAPLVYTIWNRVMRFDPKNPIWPDRDRFVLSNGHASMLLWSVLYLTGTQAVNAEYEQLGQPSVTLDDIRHFRQIGSKAPGHPEYHLVSGVEATTLEQIEDAFAVFRRTTGRPTLIILDSHIGYGSPHKVDTADAHGEPLGEEEVKLTKRAYGWPEDAKFLVPEGVREHFDTGIGARGNEAHKRWNDLFDAYSRQ